MEIRAYSRLLVLVGAEHSSALPRLAEVRPTVSGRGVDVDRSRIAIPAQWDHNLFLCFLSVMLDHVHDANS
jgi:hypothetical protein